MAEPTRVSEPIDTQTALDFLRHVVGYEWSVEGEAPNRQFVSHQWISPRDFFHVALRVGEIIRSAKQKPTDALHKFYTGTARRDQPVAGANFALVLTEEEVATKFMANPKVRQVYGQEGYTLIDAGMNDDGMARMNGQQLNEARRRRLDDLRPGMTITDPTEEELEAFARENRDAARKRWTDPFRLHRQSAETANSTTR